MSRYYASKALRQFGYQKKITNTAKQISQKGVNHTIDALSKDLSENVRNIRPKYRYKTDSMDLDSTGFNAFDIAQMYPMRLQTDVTAPTNILYNSSSGALDIHKLIGKSPKPKAG